MKHEAIGKMNRPTRGMDWRLEQSKLHIRWLQREPEMSENRTLECFQEDLRNNPVCLAIMQNEDVAIKASMNKLE